MNKVFLFTCVCLSLSLFVQSKVFDLDPTNFDSIVDGSKNVFVKFYAPWCGHCKRLAPDWEELGKSFADSPNVVIAKVDADAHRELGTRFDISGFPTLKFFSQGETTPTDYNSGRDLDSLVSFVEKKTSSKSKRVEPFSYVMTLDESNFDQIMNENPDRQLIVKFYAPWCGHCKSLAPTWEELGKIYYRDSDKVLIGKVDVTKNEQLGQRFSIQGFPTIKRITKGSEVQEYDQDRSLEAFVSWINENSNTFRNMNGLLNSKAGRVESLDAISSQFILANDKKTLIGEAEKVESVPEYSKKVYLKTMNSIVEKGNEFAQKEVDRLTRIIESKSASAEQLDNLSIRLNILKQFLHGSHNRIDDDDEH